MNRARAFLLLLLAACQQIEDTYLAPDAAVPVAPPDAELLAARPYHLAVPDAYDPAVRWPLLIALHGYGGSSPDMVQRWALDGLAQDRAMLIAVPNGLVDSRGSRAWHPGPVHSPSWDVEYLTAIIHDLKARYAIDPARVYVFGHSQGAHMTHRLGCDASEEVAAFVSIAGQVDTRPDECAPARLVSALDLHGTEDQVIGYDGDAQHDPPDPNVPSALQTIGVWGRNDGCTGPLAVTGATLDLSVFVAGKETGVQAFQGCPAGVAVELWTMNGVPHWPYPQPAFMDLVCDFLLGHPRQ